MLYSPAKSSPWYVASPDSAKLGIDRLLPLFSVNLSKPRFPPSGTFCPFFVSFPDRDTVLASKSIDPLTESPKSERSRTA